MRWLGLDVGKKRVGVALCDPEEKVVTPLGVLPFGGPEALAREVLQLVQRWEVGGVVVGVPMTRRGASPGEQRVRQVVAALQGRLPVEVETMDESGSSVEAHGRLAEAGVGREVARKVVDAVAAAVLLEAFLAQRHHRRPPAR